MAAMSFVSGFLTSGGWLSFASAGHPLYEQYGLSNIGYLIEDCFIKEVPDSGSVGVFWPKQPNASPNPKFPQFCSVFSGYTGDPFMHQKFIKHALAANIGVVCVRPSHGSSIQDMLLSTMMLYAKLAEANFPMERINFIRAISFGAYLSLYWIQQLKDTLDKVALFAPCSAEQLPEAASKIGMFVQRDGSLPINLHEANMQVRVYHLENDSVIPSKDPLFSNFARNVTEIGIKEGDHFGVDTTDEATKEIVEWFAGKES